ncbi:hypothetical protein HQ40_02000 [Porphyromonas gulae]|nr:hypothetical protein HQ40_02000 [Porphyromonas gulae]
MAEERRKKASVKAKTGEKKPKVEKSAGEKQKTRTKAPQSIGDKEDGGQVEKKKRGRPKKLVGAAVNPESESPASETPDQKSARQIRGVLEVLGVYSPAFDALIDSCVQLLYMRNKIYSEAISGCDPLSTEISREGAERKRANPAFALYIEISKELRAVLESLTMTVKSSTLASSDELDVLNKKLAAIVYENNRAGDIKES